VGGAEAAAEVEAAEVENAPSRVVAAAAAVVAVAVAEAEP